ncbi:MAG: recombinase family protein [Dehalococcoidia bacterium]|nr:recombinase family protein [Dehalococcoidia bacterium]
MGEARVPNRRYVIKTLDEIHRHDLVLPAIQREFVWRPGQICRLFDSLMQGYPFGTLLYWRIDPENSGKFQFFDFVRDYHQRDNPHCPPVGPMPDRQDVDLSVSAQLRALREYAEKNDYLVASEYVDEAESGRIADRPQFRKMLDEASKSEAPFREILVWKFSRFTRKREHTVAFKSMLRRRGVRVVSFTEQADDTPTGKLLEAIIESVDEFYSENLAQEVTRGVREAVSRGFWVNSSVPYGYRRVYV